MSPFPKPRGFWDYALFAVGLTGALVFLFWMEASYNVGWADAALASAAAVLGVLIITLARRREKARWIQQPTWYTYPLANLGALALIFGTTYADAYLFHRGEITSNCLRRNTVFVVVLTATTAWPSLRRQRSKREIL